MTMFGEDTVHPEDIVRIARSGEGVRISEVVYERLAQARRVVDKIVADGTPAYGITRGLGPLREQDIPYDAQAEFQAYTIASHDTGVGRMLSRVEVRAVIAARLSGMTQGKSGASPELFDRLAMFLERDLAPAVPAEGSVGAGDLSSLAAIGSVAIGRGRALPAGRHRVTDRQTVPGARALAEAGLEPLQLQAKDALALVGSNSATVGITSIILEDLGRLADQCDVVAALSMEVAGANPTALSHAIAAARPFPGQIRSAARLRDLLHGGDLASGDRFVAVQDHVSFRTVPQVHGVLLDALQRIEETLTVELNSPSENPFIDTEAGEVISGGNFSTARLALDLESARLALAHIAILSERRCARLVALMRSDRSLVQQLQDHRNGAHMPPPMIIAQSAVATLGRIQQRAAPVTILGSPVGDGVEDHNAQTRNAALQLEGSIRLLRHLLATESLAATTAMEIMHSEDPPGFGHGVTAFQERLKRLLAQRADDVPVTYIVEDITHALEELIEPALADTDRTSIAPQDSTLNERQQS